MTDLALRLLSLLWPVRAARWEGRYQPVVLSYELGRPVVNSLRANQSWGNLHRLWQQVLGHVLTGTDAPGRALVLGFGAGSVASILHHEHRLPTALTGVEGEPWMLRMAERGHRPFHLHRTELHADDAFAWAAQWQGVPFPLVVVDLFVELDVPPPAAEDAFLDDLRRLTAPGGTLAFNTIAHDEKSARLSERIGVGLRHRFSSMETLSLEGINRVFIAR